MTDVAELFRGFGLTAPRPGLDPGPAAQGPGLGPGLGGGGGLGGLLRGIEGLRHRQRPGQGQGPGLGRGLTPHEQAQARQWDEMTPQQRQPHDWEREVPN